MLRFLRRLTYVDPNAFDEEGYAIVKLITMVMAIVVPVSLVSVPVYMYMGHYSMVLFFSPVYVLSIWVIFAVKRTQNPKKLALIFCWLSMLIIIGLIVVFGFGEAHNFFSIHFILTCLFSGFMLNTRWTVIFASISAITSIITYGSDFLGLALQPIVVIDEALANYFILINILAALAISTATCVFYLRIRKKYYSQLKEKTLTLNALLEHLPIILYRIDAKGNMLEMNGKGLTRPTTFSRAHMANSLQNIFDLFPEKEPEFLQALRGGNVEFPISGQENGSLWNFSNYLFFDKLRQKGAIGLATDLTPETMEQAIFEANLHRAIHHAQRANQAKTKFLATMSHEIRTPLNAINGFAEVLLGQELDKSSQEYIRLIYDSGTALLSLLNDILDLNKIEEGKLQIESIPFELRPELENTIKPYLYIMKEKGLVFDLKVDNKLPQWVKGDPLRLRQILINLLSNAIKFTHKGMIRVVVVQKASAADRLTLTLTVSDTGIGISKEKQSHVFNTFSQADESITRQFGGTGLGLPIVRQLTELMGGNTGLNSPSALLQADEGGPGTDVWASFSLGVTEDTPPADSYPLIQNNKGQTFPNPVHILVVEDNKVNQLLFQKMLQKMGATISLANNGQEAVLFLENNPQVDIIIMDVQMPVMDGYEATGAIRKILGLKTPIIAATASAYQEDIDRSRAAGMDDFIAKPFKHQDLYIVVSRWIPHPTYGIDQK